ncbi:hypothetical protein Hanom_Chr03g00266081 [Helianthus anomalus]
MGDCAPLFSSDCSPSPPLSLPEPQKKRKMILYDDDEEVNQVSLPLHEEEEDEEEDEEEVGENVKPIGDIIRVSFIEGYRRDHYHGFQANGGSYELEDVVLVVPDEIGINMKPSVAMIKVFLLYYYYYYYVFSSMFFIIRQ